MATVEAESPIDTRKKPCKRAIIPSLALWNPTYLISRTQNLHLLHFTAYLRARDVDGCIFSLLNGYRNGPQGSAPESAPPTTREQNPPGKQGKANHKRGQW